MTTAGDHKAIYTVDAQGADPQPLIDLGSGRDAINPAWSWDGQSIAFAGQTSPGGLFVIYVANADGTGTPQQITEGHWEPGISSSDTDPTWEPYGEHIAFVRTLGDGTSIRSAIWTVELATGSATPVYFGSDLDLAEPAWSPDGTRIAFTGRLTSCAQEPCRWGIGIWDVEHARFTNPLNYNAFYDWHNVLLRQPVQAPKQGAVVASRPDGGTAYLGGFASIQGMDGEFPFVAVIIAGASTASPDRFELRVYEPGTVIASPTPLLAASGDAGGQIQIRS